MHVRQATPADTDTIVEFNCRLASETESKELDRALLRDGVHNVLSDPQKGLYFVAEADDRVVGQVMITFEWSDWRNGTIWWLQSVYVHADYRRRGVFRQLMEHVDRLQQETAGVIGLRLYVERENNAAQNTYRRLAFRDGNYVVMERLPAD